MMGLRGLQAGRTTKTSRPVTVLRKSGKLDEAFELACRQAAEPDADDWDIADLGWCLIDLIKRCIANDDQTSLQEYLTQLARLSVADSNDVLIQQRERTLLMADGQRRQIVKLTCLSKEGRHAEAIDGFSKLLAEGVLLEDDKIAYGWELFRANQATLKSTGEKELSSNMVDALKRRLSTYLNLGIFKQGLLHTCFLQQAERLARRDQLRLVAFVKLWNLDLLQAEDFRESRAEGGKTYPALAEVVIQRASKEAADGSPAEMEYILPHVESASKRYPENVWLKLNRVKLLRGLGRLAEARELAVEFARLKAGEYWAWELVGDLADDPAMRKACYAKALTCSDDDTFVTKVRLKFADLIKTDHPGNAKGEIERVIERSRKEGHRVPKDAEGLAREDWFGANQSVSNGRVFYDRFKLQAEELLFSHVPWSDASVGEEFTIKGRDGQKDRVRRRLYVATTPIPSEVSVSASHPDIRKLAVGTPIRVQMETDAKEAWKQTVHRIQPRPEGSQDDVVNEVHGVVDHVNRDRGLAHFVVSKSVDGTFPLDRFPVTAELGQVVAIRVVRYHDKNGPRTRALTATSSTETLPSSVMRPFRDTVIVRNGLWFTEAGILIPRDLVDQAGVEEDDTVQGIAVINFDKKRGVWGWKAIKVG